MILEGALAVLLLAVIAMAWRVERRLAAIRNAESGLRAAVAELAQTTERAQAAINGLRVSADQSGKDLQTKIDEARQLAARLARPTGLR